MQIICYIGSVTQNECLVYKAGFQTAQPSLRRFILCADLRRGNKLLKRCTESTGVGEKDKSYLLDYIRISFFKV